MIQAKKQHFGFVAILNFWAAILDFIVYGINMHVVPYVFFNQL